MKIFSGKANIELAKKIAANLDEPLSTLVADRFNDGEMRVEVCDSVRGEDVFVVQPTCAPTNDNLMELLIIIDALRWASPARITAVIPYFGYARQDRRPRSVRVPITARLVAKMIGNAGADRVITMDLHSDQIQGFFDVVTDNVYSSPTMLGDMWRQNYFCPMVISPDAGGVIRARALAKRLGDADLAIIDKRRSAPGVVADMHVIGSVEDRTCIIADDMVDTAGTLCRAADALMEAGARRVVAYCTHPVLSGGAVGNVNRSALSEMVVTNTIPLSLCATKCPKIRQLDVSEILAETIRRTHTGESVGSIFVD